MRKRLRRWPRTFNKRCRRWRRRTAGFIATKQGVRNLLALVALGLSIYRLTEGLESEVTLVAILLIVVSVALLMFGFWQTWITRIAKNSAAWLSSVVDDVLRLAEGHLKQLTVLILIVAAILSFVLWNWLTTGTEIHTESQGNQQTIVRTEISESGSTTVRNLGLFFAALLALPIAVWRTRIAQIEATTAQREHFNSLYREGSEKLVNDELAVRLDGIHILERLMKDEPEQYHIQIISRLCAFLRSSEQMLEGNVVLYEDIRAVAVAIRSRGKAGLTIEDQSRFFLDLNGTDLRGVWFSRVMLPRADLCRAKLENANLYAADLSGARFYSANLNDASLYDANLTGAEFSLDGKYPATGLTQEQIDYAWADKDKLPKLEGVKDAVTGNQLTPPRRRMSFANEMEQFRAEIKRALDDT